MNRICTILCFAAIGIVACRKKSEWPSPEYAKLVGNWEWEETSGGVFFSIYTPNSTGITKQLEFTDRQICRIFENNKKQETAIYSIKEYENTPTRLKYRLYMRKRVSRTDLLNELQGMAVSFRGNDTLDLTSTSSDGFNLVYIRK